MNLKVALITGGSSGIGAATALTLAKAGIKVYAASRRGTTPVEHPLVVPVRLDINDEAGTEKVVADIVNADGRLDAVVCNAGAGIYGPVENTTDAEVREQFETTYFGSLKTIRTCIPVFRKQGCGRIITITSVMGPTVNLNLLISFSPFVYYQQSGTASETGERRCDLRPG